MTLARRIAGTTDTTASSCLVNGRYKLRGSLPLGQPGSVGFQFLSRDRVAHNPASGELVGKKRLRPFICLLRQRGHPRAATAAREGVIGVVLVDRDQRIVLQRSADLAWASGGENLSCVAICSSSGLLMFCRSPSRLSRPTP